MVMYLTVKYVTIVISVWDTLWRKQMNIRWIKAVSAAAVLSLLCAGCGLGNQNENIEAGMTAVKALDYDTALASFEAAKEAGENERLLYRGEGIAYLGKTQYAEAVSAFETALSFSDGRVDDMDYDVNYYLATAYYKQGETDQALQVYDAIIALRPEERDAYYLRGVIEAERGNLEQALADFDMTISLNARDYDRLIDIYCVLSENGYKESGQTYLQSAMESGTKYMTNFEKGRISYYLGDYENARTYLDKAKEESGYEAVLFLGKTHEELGDYNYAISVYNTFLNDSGEVCPEILNQMGLCKMEMGDYEGALQAFQQAMQVEDNGMMQVLKMNEIVAYEKLGEYKQAAVLLGNYLKTYPDDETAKREYEFLKTR